MKRHDRIWPSAEMGPGNPEEPGIQAIFDAAIDFGLTDEEVLRAADEALHEAGTVPEYLDALNASLARSILSKQRRLLSEQPPS